MTLAVILLLLSDVRLALSRRTSLATLSDAASLSHCLLGLPRTILLKLIYIFARLDITYSALTRRKTAVSSGA
jgi:hypothetical protein